MSDTIQKPPRKATYGRNFSYFSHRLFVVHEPGELHDYLERLFEIKGFPREVAEIESEFARWVLLHRSELHPLALNRLITAWRTADDRLAVPGELGARSSEYQAEITMQFAIELTLAQTHHARWLQERPHLQQARLDAAYYLSRRWPDAGAPPVRPVNGAAPADGGRDHIVSLEDADRDAFVAYLQSRQNLLDVEGGDDLPPTAATLSEDEKGWLFDIARGVASRLTWTKSRDEWQNDWNGCMKGSVRDTYGAAANASGALFDKLLVAPCSVLVPKNGGGEHRYRWRYLRSGKPLDAAQARTQAEASADALRTIADIEDLMQASLALPTDATPAGRSVMAEMADTYRVWPTTPEWDNLDKARVAMAEAARGLYRSDLDTQRGHIDAYLTMLGDTGVGQAAAHAVLLALALARTAGEPTGPGDWRRALVTVRDGLALQECSPGETGQRLASAYRGLRTLWSTLPELPPPPAAGPLSEWHAKLPELAKRVRATPSDAVAVPGDAVVTQAWDAVVIRLQALAAGAPVPPAGAAELVLGHRATDPLHRTLLLRPDTLNLRQSTALLLGASSSAAMPAWLSPQHTIALAAHALERMGFAPLRSDEPAHRLQKQLPLFADALLAYARQHIRRSADVPPPRAALVIGADAGSSITDNWPLPPRQTFTVRATPAQLDGLFKLGIDAAMAACSAVRVAHEPDAGRGDVAKGWLGSLLGRVDPVRQLEEALAKHPDAPPLREIWLGPASGPDAPAPRVAAPMSADDLWFDLPDLPDPPA